MEEIVGHMLLGAWLLILGAIGIFYSVVSGDGESATPIIAKLGYLLFLSITMWAMGSYFGGGY